MSEGKRKGLIEWIRRVWSRRNTWRTLAEERERTIRDQDRQLQIEREDNQRWLLVWEALGRPERPQSWASTASLARVKELLEQNEALSRDLANILTGFQLIWERVKSLDAKLGGTLWDSARETPAGEKELQGRPP